MPEEREADLEVGHVGRPHGLKGEVVVRFVTDRPERWARGAELRAGTRSLVVASSREHQGRHLVLFEGFKQREQVAELTGSKLTAAPIDDPDVLWIHELIGSEVVEVDGTPRGRVELILENPASDLLQMDTGALIPLRFVESFEAGEAIVVDVPAGLFDLDEQ